MSYRLVLTKSPQEDMNSKDVGDNVFLENLSRSYQVYLFYYPGHMPLDVEQRLSDLGKKTGANLFVNLSKLDDPNYKKLVNYFGIRKLPVVILFATSELSSPPDISCNAFVRIDNEGVLQSPDQAIELITTIFNLFIGGKVAEALKEVAKSERKLLFERIRSIFTGLIKGVGKFIDERNFSISVKDGKFDITKQ